MKIIAEREKILSALEFVSKYADAKSRISILECVLFDAGERGVSVTGTDLDKGAIDSFEAHVDRTGAVCLNGTLLVKAIKSTDASEVQIDAGEKEAAIQIGGKLRLKLPILPDRDFPDLAFLTKETECNFTVDAGLLERHAKEVAFAESRETRARQSLLGTFWNIDHGTLDLCATDSKMLSVLSVPAPDKNIPSVIVPSLALPEWKDEISVSVSENFIRFSCGKQVVGSKLVEGTYPPYRRVIPDNPTKLLFDRDELASAIARMNIVGTPNILFVGRDGKAVLSAIREGREITDEIAFDGDDFQICLAHPIIAPVVSSFHCETIEWRWADHTTSITIHNPHDDSRIAVAFPYSDARILQYITTAREAA